MPNYGRESHPHAHYCSSFNRIPRSSHKQRRLLGASRGNFAQYQPEYHRDNQRVSQLVSHGYQSKSARAREGETKFVATRTIVEEWQAALGTNGLGWQGAGNSNIGVNDSRPEMGGAWRWACGSFDRGEVGLPAMSWTFVNRKRVE